MAIKTKHIFAALETWAPKSLAYDWDNIGLQVGSYDQDVNNILVSLDCLNSTVDEAIEKNIDLIVAHHPLLFKPLNQIDFATPKGKIIQKLIKHNISVYASHTNLDIAEGGVNDLLSDVLQLQNKQPLIPFKTDQLVKLAVFVPPSHADSVRDALSKSGAGHIGNYSHCTFQTKGEGTFKPLAGTNPYSGTVNKLEYVDELKIETIVKQADLRIVVEAMKRAHPYEEVAYDLYPLLNEGTKYGLGRIGKLQEEVQLADFCKVVKNAFDCETIKVTGDLSKQVQTVAIVGGSGEKFIHDAKQQGADVYITGDMTFHHAQDAEEMGLAVIDAGHYIEKIMKQATKQFLQTEFTKEAIQVFVSERNTNPFQYI